MREQHLAAVKYSQATVEGTMMRRPIARFLLVIFLLGVGQLAAIAAQPDTFSTEERARQHCPSDTVVWLNLPSGIYHLKGQRYFANTKAGAYACKKEADKAGDRPSLNGQ